MATTMNLQEAADFLHMNIETVRRMAQSGTLPAAKPGKRWVFIQEDLVFWLRSFYAQERRALLSEKPNNKGGKLCHSTNATKRGGLISPHRVESELDNLLARK